MTLPERLKLVRKESNAKTQKAFAESLGVSSNYIYLLENDRETPSERLLKDICRIYDVNYSWLAEEIGDMRSEEGDMQAIVDAVMSGDDDFAKKTLVAFAKMTSEQWMLVKQLVDSLKE